MVSLQKQIGLPVELFKSGSPILHHALLNLVHKIWREECIPGGFKSSTVIPVVRNIQERLQRASERQRSQ